MASTAIPEHVAARQVAPLHWPLLPVAALGAFLAVPWIRANTALAAAFVTAAAALLLYWALLVQAVRRSGRTLRYEFVPRPVHYVQMAMHSSIYIYWGWYWREVYHYVPLILAQVAFLYALDMLVCWSRRDGWVLGFGPFPIVLSTNLFLWFKDDWFFLQFLLIATAVLCKEFVTWKRDGRRTHIFNPSAIALALFSAGLLITRTTPITWGEEVAVTLGRPPHIYLEIFALGLVVQALFSVTLVTLAAAAMLFVLNLAYTGWTGVYHFIDSNIPIAVFLGLHLLVTDPATSPRKNLGKVIFGALYGAGVFALYSVLGSMGAPTFYDKLLCVPPLNLLVRVLDRATESMLRRYRSSILGGVALFRGWTPRHLNYAHMGVWVGLFATMFTTGFVEARHPGSDPEFWRTACEAGRYRACAAWSRTASLICSHGSSRACFSLGAALAEGRLLSRDVLEAGRNFARACDLGDVNGCLRLIELVEAAGEARYAEACNGGDGESCYLLGSLYHAGRGVPKDDAKALDLFRKSCDTGSPRGCGRVAESYRRGEGTTADTTQAVAYFEKACRAGHAQSCFNAGLMYRGMKNEAVARMRFRQACDDAVRYAQTNAAYYRVGAALPNPYQSPLCSQRAP